MAKVKKKKKVKEKKVKEKKPSFIYKWAKHVEEIISVYDNLYYTHLTKNKSLIVYYIPKETHKVGMDFAGMYDGDNVTYFYRIDRLPAALYTDFKARLRRECVGDVRLSFVTDIQNHSILWDSPQLRSRLRILKDVGDENNKTNVNAYNLHDNVESLSRQEWIEDSLEYLALADKKRGRRIIKVSFLVIISGKRGELFDTSVTAVEKYAKDLGVGLERVLYDIHKVLPVISPFSNKYNQQILRETPSMVLTDEIIARFNGYNQGKLGRKGTYFGTDVYSHFPVVKKVKPKIDTAENWLITAETGGGKSFFVKGLILQLLAQKFNGTIMDIEGFEYIPLAKFLNKRSKVKVLNMAEGVGNYFDPVPIPKAIGIPEVDMERKKLALNFVSAILKVLVGKIYEENIWVGIVLDDAITDTYEKLGVTDDESTWAGSEDGTLHDIYNRLEHMHKFRHDDGYEEAVNLCVALLGRYFKEGGTKTGVFKNRVVIDEIIDADLLICSFGMAGKSPATVDPINLALMQLSAALISHQRSIFSKAQGKFNFKLWEEFQRWGKFPDSDKTLGVALTGGRKLGDVNMIITNIVADILRDDTFGIFGNVQSFMIGAIIDKKVREELCERLTIPEMLIELNAIAKYAKIGDDDKQVNQSDQTEHPLTYSFLCCLDRNKYGITKMDLPLGVKKSEIFKTGVDLNIA